MNWTDREDHPAEVVTVIEAELARLILGGRGRPRPELNIARRGLGVSAVSTLACRRCRGAL